MPVELHAALLSDNPPLVVDVREADELTISALPNYLHIPMGEFAARIGEVPADREVVIVCRSGSRSGRVVTYMRSLGYTRVKNLVGGMNGWAAEVDPSLPQY